VDVFVRERAALTAAADFAAREIGLYTAPSLPLPALAAHLGVGARRLRALVDVLRHEGWPATRPPPSPAPPPHGVGRLAEVLRNDAPLDEPADLRRYHEHLYREGAAAAEDVLSALGPARALLDAGGGAGGYTDAFLRRNPGARAVLVDRPEVVALAREALAPHGDRVRFVAGDLFDADLGAGHDLALLSNVTHWLAPEACGRLVARVAAALAPDGRLAVKDLYVEPDRSGPLRSLLFALSLAVYAEDGDVHDVAATSAWLRDAGLRDVTLARLPRDEMIVQGIRR
jgi:SAM-dependent methyltransferase